MSERQVQYTDGSWSREVEVGDELLDRARRQVRGIDDPSVREQLIIDLIERVQQAEAERDSLRFELDGARAVARFTTGRLIAERDAAREDCNKNAGNVRRLTLELHAARGKLDKVREWAHHIRTTRQRGDIEYNAAADVLTILDGKTGD